MKSALLALALYFALVQSDGQPSTPVFQADTIVLTATIRDFWGAFPNGTCVDNGGTSLCGHSGLPVDQQFDCSSTQCYVDFENMCCGYEVGALGPLGSQLDADGKPVLVNNKPDGATQLWSTQQNFARWYRDSPGYNIPLSINLTFTNTEAYPSLYSWGTSNFFPIDGQGFGNYWGDHNFAFTTEIKARFVYQGGEVFSFTGDDDLWVFINNSLVVDLGGVHSATTWNLTVDDLKLTKGQNYPFTIFHAERHITQSNFNAYTSIALYCPWYDWCGVCQGTGQSCCTKNGKNLCEDNNPCTNDYCNALNGTCMNVPYTCPANPDSCTISYCDITVSPFNNQTSCKMKARDCSDGLACTDDTCYPSSGCSSVVKVCDDSNDCTFNMCNNSTGCYFPNNTCDDGDKCTSDSCQIHGGCQNVKINCDDNDPCTTDSCDSLSGCKNVNITTGCDNCKRPDIEPCTYTDFCHPKQCDPVDGGCKVHYNVTCDSGNACSVGTCNPTNGSCSFAPLPCVSNDPCVIASCDPKIGCVFTDFVLSCADTNLCTNKSCAVASNGTAYCNRTNVICDDNDPCTIDACDPTTQCYSKKKDCDDNNPCTTDSCNAITGACQNTVTPLPNLGACNTSYCDTQLGIITSPVVCKPVDRCSCDPVKGCVCKDLSFLSNLTTTTKGIGGGIIAAIVIASVVGIAGLIIGGKKGLDYLGKNAIPQGAVKTNPLFQESSSNSDNPLYKEADDPAAV